MTTETHLIPRRVLMADPDVMNVKLAPDGARLAWLGDDDNGRRRIWVWKLEDGDPEAIPDVEASGIDVLMWSADGRSLLYTQDSSGFQQWRLLRLDVQTGAIVDCTPFEGVQVRLFGTYRGHPAEVLVGLNRRDPFWHDLYSLNLASRELRLLAENPGTGPGDGATEFLVDASLAPRLAIVKTAEDGHVLSLRAAERDGWEPWLAMPPGDACRVFSLSPDGRTVWLASSEGRDTAAVVEIDVESRRTQVLAASPDVDVEDVWLDPTTGRIQAAAFDAGRRSWFVIDPAVAADIEGIAQLGEGDTLLLARDDADRRWLVADHTDTGAIRYFLWERTTRRARFLFASMPQLEGHELSPMVPVQVPCRDGLVMHGFLTRPRDASEPVPLVLFVHGGPWGRDRWGYHAWPQLFANRGYACLQVNFRGSAGFGKAFLNAGNKQWGRAMQHDLIDAVRWAENQGITVPGRVAIVGGSYGGYAALMGVAQAPECFACAVALNGPTDLPKMIASVPPFLKWMQAIADARIGDLQNPDERQRLEETSPVSLVRQFSRPVLLAHGANDPIVRIDDTARLAESLSAAGIEVSLVVYPDEGHDFIRATNRIDYAARVEAFISRHLGGRSEPEGTLPFPGSSAMTPRLANATLAAQENV